MNIAVIILLIFCLLFASLKKVNCYNAFITGAKQAFPLAVSLFPYVSAVLIAVALLRLSGLSGLLTELLTPVFCFLGIPEQLCELIIFRPFTGSGSLALLADVLSQYGADSYVSRCACIILGSSETVFYCAAVYFAGIKAKGTGKAVGIALLCSFVGAIVACLLCRVM